MVNSNGRFYDEVAPKPAPWTKSTPSLIYASDSLLRRRFLSVCAQGFRREAMLKVPLGPRLALLAEHERLRRFETGGARQKA